jgi:hypothetical protein
MTLPVSPEAWIVFQWLVQALEQDLSRYPSDHLLTDSAPQPVSRAATPGEVRAWRKVLAIANKTLKRELPPEFSIRCRDSKQEGEGS